MRRYPFLFFQANAPASCQFANGGSSFEGADVRHNCLKTGSTSFSQLCCEPCIALVVKRLQAKRLRFSLGCLSLPARSPLQEEEQTATSFGFDGSADAIARYFSTALPCNASALQLLRGAPTKVGDGLWQSNVYLMPGLYGGIDCLLRRGVQHCCFTLTPDGFLTTTTKSKPVFLPSGAGLAKRQLAPRSYLPPKS